MFANFVLADEINRAPAKVQSALLEAMQERQVTIGDTSYELPSPFLVLATQNPIEQEGTYPLPEAQVDRFLLKLKVDYPSPEEERQILDRMTGSHVPEVKPVVALEEIERLHPALYGSICDETGKVRRHINLFVNTSHVRDREGIDTVLVPGDEVTILPAVSGG